MPDNVTEIGPYAFADCSMYTSQGWGYVGLTNVTIGRSVTRIADYTFYRAEALRNVVLLCENLVHIGDYAFAETRVDFDIPGTVTYIGTYALQWHQKRNMIIPDSVTYIGDYAFRDSNARNFEFSDSITHLGDAVLYGAYYLETVKFPSSINRIPRNMFYYCYMGLTNITIPDFITTIDDLAFNE